MRVIPKHISARLSGKYYAILLILLVTGLLSGCKGKNDRHVTRGIYYWKNSFQTAGYTGQRLKEMQCQNIFLHCFDVDWDAAKAAPAPIAVVRVQQPRDTTFILTPVVFITQPAIRNISISQLPALAANISKLLQQLMTGQQVHEIQIDCDWTASTRESYFALLTHLKMQPFFQGKKLSCTIRLHQVKYALKSGIPPVDKGLLMCYNVGNLKKTGDHNSILDVALVKDYLANAGSYPLKLDIALPLFSWCLQFRGATMKGILRDVDPLQIKNSTLFKHSAGHLYTCMADTVWLGYSFSNGDIVRLEETTLQDLNAVAAYTARQVKADSLAVILFHADSVTLSKYSNNDLEAVYSAYH